MPRRSVLVARWGGLLAGQASLEVLISFANPGPTATGRSEIYEQAAAAEIRTGIDPNGLAPDIVFNFNST